MRTHLALLTALAVGGAALAFDWPHPRRVLARGKQLLRSGARRGLQAADRRGWVPGSQSTDIDHLHPDFRPKVARVVSELESEGHRVRVVGVWRSPSRQDAIYRFSRVMERLGASPGTRVRGGQSCHNQLASGAPASAAVDIRPGRGLSLDEQAEFFHALGRAADDEGLRWGGDWSRSNPTWARRGLGWDPGHVEDRALCRALRR